MRKILNGKIKLLEISFLLLICYPLLKFNISSLLLIVFCVLACFNAIKERKFYFTKKNGKRFFTLTFYLFLLLVSVFYSENSGKAINRILQLMPLLLVPFVILFINPKFSEGLRTKALNLFLICNVTYVLILAGVYVGNTGLGAEYVGRAGLIPSYDKIQFILNSVIPGDLLFVHKAYFSMGFVLLAVFALERANAFFKVNRRRSNLYLATFLFFASIVIYTYSFPNILALIGCIFFFILFENSSSTLSIKKRIIPFGIVICLGVAAIFYSSKDLDIKRGISFINSVIFQKDTEGNDPRIEIYKTYNSLLKQGSTANLFFGFGVGDEQDLLHEEVGNRLREHKNKNLLFYNEEFNNAYWFRNYIEVNSNKVQAPNGKKTADLLIEVNNPQEVSHNISTDYFLEENVMYTFSVYAKAFDADKLVLRLGDMENRAYFNLTDGNVIGKYEGVQQASIVALNDQWYRCSISVKGKGNALVILGIPSDTGNYHHIGFSRGIYVWGAQLERRRSASDYIKNGSELMTYLHEENLNSHNNYLFFLITGGLLCLAAFLLSLGALFFVSFKNRNILQWSLCLIIALNFLTENIFSRHWGLMFVAVMVIVLFTSSTLKNNAEKPI